MEIIINIVEIRQSCRLEETYCHSNSSGKPSTKVKNSPRSKIIITLIGPTNHGSERKRKTKSKSFFFLLFGWYNLNNPKVKGKELAQQYYTKLKSCQSDLAYNCIFKPRHKYCFAKKKEKLLKLFGLRMDIILEESEISITNQYTWNHHTKGTTFNNKKSLKVILELRELPKTKTHPSTY